MTAGGKADGVAAGKLDFLQKINNDPAYDPGYI